MPCPRLHRIAFPVVSEWCQYRPRGRSPGLLALAIALSSVLGSKSLER